MPKVDTQAAYGVGLYGGAARGKLYTDISVGKSNLGAGVCCFDRWDMMIGIPDVSIDNGNRWFVKQKRASEAAGVCFGSLEHVAR
jgi:hypothetical protein